MPSALATRAHVRRCSAADKLPGHGGEAWSRSAATAGAVSKECVLAVLMDDAKAEALLYPERDTEDVAELTPGE